MTELLKPAVLFSQTQSLLSWLHCSPGVRMSHLPVPWQHVGL